MLEIEGKEWTKRDGDIHTYKYTYKRETRDAQLSE